jgi:DNA segregation ATPase FtsK/SpoIIIE, S-DNA-T family
VAMTTASYHGPFTVDDLRALINRRLRELAGLVLIALVGAAAAALATWSVKDPSLSHATSEAVRNLLGEPGAIAADLAMQLLGLATIAFLLPIAAWGWRLFTHRPIDRMRWRLPAWLFGVIAAAAFASCLARTAQWPLPTGLGGVVGDAVIRTIASITGGPLFGTGRMVVTASFSAIGLVLLTIASGFGFQRSEDAAGADDEEDGGSISLGWAMHHLLSLKAWVFRPVANAVGAAYRSMLSRPAAPAKAARAEPRFGAASGPAAAQEPDEDDAEADEEEEAETSTKITRPEKKKPAKAAPKGAKKSSDKSSDGYEMPPLNLLAAAKSTDRYAPSSEALQETAGTLEHVLGDFGVRGAIINARPGPVVTLYELEPAPGIKSSRVIGLADDIARSMSALSARVAVVSGRNVIGIELPNTTREKVYLRELLAADEYTGTAARLPLCLGKTIGGESVIVDLARMPHLLIAGTTGSGKSVAINTMILSLLYRLKPDQCRLIMVDPKMLELSVYDGIPHLLTPVVTDPKKAVVALKWAVREMEDRYKKMAKLGVRNIDGYNVRLSEARARGEMLSRTVHTGYDPDSGEAIYEKE